MQNIFCRRMMRRIFGTKEEGMDRITRFVVLLSTVFFLVRQPLLGQDLLIIETSHSHSGTPHSLGLL
jgi:hypothetical protein